MTSTTGPDQVRAWAAGLARARPATGAEPADVLAGVGAALGVGWDGPGEPIDVVLPEADGWLLLDAAREAVLGGDRRRRLGAHHTPPDLARRLVAVALDGGRGPGAGAVVVDPACGGGAFLVAAAEALVAAGADPERVVGRQLTGIDLDPLAAATSRAALRSWASSRGVTGEVRADVRVGDGLAETWPADVVVGNPPFLSPLATATGGTPAADARRRRLGAPYADTACLFLLRALEQVRPGGRVVLLQPESLLTSRDARPVREAAGPHLDGLWVAGEAVFGAAVRVCAPMLVRGRAPAPVRRWTGRSVRRTSPAPLRSGDDWAGLRPTTAPPVRVRRGGRVVADIAVATAGFRDEFYGIAAAVTDGGAGHPVVTSGLIDPGSIAWGHHPARIAGARFERPVVDDEQLDDRLRAWVTARLVPKVLVATQTRVVEAAPDPGGRFVPLTPVVSVAPRDAGDVLRLAAALSSPLVSAWALRTAGGAALSADAIKLSARQVLDAPLPSDAGAWAEATAALAGGSVVDCARVLAGTDRRLLAWWEARLPGRPRTAPGRAQAV